MSRLSINWVQALLEDPHAEEHEAIERSDFGGGADDLQMDFDSLASLRLLSRFMPITTKYDPDGRFFVYEDADGDGARRRQGSSGSSDDALPRFSSDANVPDKPASRGLLPKATPLFAVLLVVETTDLIFAADSIPAVLSITNDPVIAYTSNIFAILGLRALYFALAALMQQFLYLGRGLGLILMFIGAKLLLGFVEIHISVEVTLFVVLSVLTGSVICSSMVPKKSGSRGLDLSV